MQHSLLDLKPREQDFPLLKAKLKSERPTNKQQLKAAIIVEKKPL